MQASPRFSRAVLAVCLALAVGELCLFVLLWRLDAWVDPGADRRATLLLVVFGSVVTLQAMVVVGAAWVAVAMSRTTLRAEAAGVWLEHPWRRWHGGWADVAHAWQQHGWVVLQVRGHWRRWYVRAGGGHGNGELERLRARLPPGVWLDGAGRRRHLARTTLPVVLAATGLGGLLLLWGLQLIRSL